MKINHVIGAISILALGLSLASCKNDSKETSNISNVTLETGDNLASVPEYYTADDALSYEELLEATCEMALNSTVCVKNYQTIVSQYISGWGPGATITTAQEHTLFGFGSGVIYYKALTTDGDYLYKLITNEHVVAVDSEYTVVEGEEEYKLYDENYNEEIELSLIGSDSTNDIAVLSFVSSRDYSAVSFANEETVKVGSSVIAVGTPISLEFYNSCTFGIVSKINSSTIQHNATINSGNSGGPLFNTSGSLVGINNAKLSGSTSSGVTIEGIYFAIPLSVVSSTVVSITGVNDIVYA